MHKLPNHFMYYTTNFIELQQYFFEIIKKIQINIKILLTHFFKISYT